MRVIDITIDKRKVWSEVAMLSEYIGAKLETTTDQYERLMLTDADIESLSSFFTTAAQIAITYMKDKVVEHSEDDDVLKLKLEVSRMWDEKMLPTITSMIESYLTNAIFASYLRTCLPDKEEAYATSAQGNLEIAVSALLKRIRPVRSGREER